MKLRMQITKDKDIRFISHLEYVRTIGRAIRRAKLPAAYSEGFNPHLKFSLASALGVGVVSYTEFVEIVSPEYVKMRVWERGTGETLACGTGCCATAVACVLNGKTGRKVTVEVLGGALTIQWDDKTNHIFMTGPAEFVFDGELEYEV